MVAVAEPTVTDLPFSHGDHGDVFRARGVACVHCHPVGVEGAELPAPPRSACHGCHLRNLDGAPRKVDRTCDTCHERSSLLPETHGPSWIPDHAIAARANYGECMDCHDATTCVRCHDRRGALSENPHKAGWMAIHGVEARLDAAMCESCHTGETCASCHTGGGPIR